MASLQLNNIQKIYPSDTEKRRRKSTKAGAQENKHHLQVTEEGIVAVQSFTLDIADREFVVLVGPSGCGKSTTLRMIAGLEEITAGDLYIGGRLVNDLPPKERDIAMVFQSYALYPHMTVFDNMAFSLKLSKKPKAEIRRRVLEAAEVLGITEYLDRKPRALSGGQRQRVAIGRAIVREPQVFLMDEPLSNLDAKLRSQMRAELIKLRERIDTTFIYVTHDQTEAMTLGDRIVVMKDGFIQQIGTPQEVFSRPANRFVAGFIGTPQMNFFETAELEPDDSGREYRVLLLGQSIPLPHKTGDMLAKAGIKKRPVILGVRPGGLQAAEEGQGFESAAEVVEWMGDRVHVHFSLAGQEAVAVLPADALPAVSSGAKLHLLLPGEECHLFDAESGKNLLCN